MEKYIIVEDKKGNLSIVSNQEYQKENVNRLKWDAISGSDEIEEAEKILAHIKEVGGVQNYFLELMDKDAGKNSCFDCRKVAGRICSGSTA